jgi:dethiobiotin synthetase
VPWLAAHLEGKKLAVDEIIASGAPLMKKYDTLLIEGAGGLVVPLNAGEMIADLAVQLGYPLVIVARPGLGTINHTLLTIAYARSKNLAIAGIIFNGYKDSLPPPINQLSDIKSHSEFHHSEKSNPFMVEYLSGIPVLGTVAWMNDDLTFPERLRIFSTQVNLDHMLKTLS